MSGYLGNCNHRIASNFVEIDTSDFHLVRSKRKKKKNSKCINPQVRLTQYRLKEHRFENSKKESFPRDDGKSSGFNYRMATIFHSLNILHECVLVTEDPGL